MQTIKAQRISAFGERVTALEGIFFLKLIEKRLTIGASNKTFRKADQKEPLNEDSESDSQKIIKPRKSKKNKDKQSVEPAPDASSQSTPDTSSEPIPDTSSEPTPNTSSEPTS